jgi:phospholipid transport system substrate-binding protein
VILVWALALVLPLALGRVGFADDTRKRDDAGPTDGTLAPLNLVKSSVSRVRAILPSRTAGDAGSEDRRTEIRRVAHALFDFDEMARRALGRHWKGLAPPEQAEFSRLFTNVIEQVYVTAVEAYAAPTVAFQGDKVTGTYARVRSRMITPHGPEISIEYHLFERNSRWAVYDLLVDGVSLVSNYRSQFNSIIRASSLAQLLEKLRMDRPRYTQSRGAVESSRAPQLAPSTRERLAAGLLVVMTSSRRQ